MDGRDDSNEYEIGKAVAVQQITDDARDLCLELAAMSEGLLKASEEIHSAPEDDEVDQFTSKLIYMLVNRIKGALIRSINKLNATLRNLNTVLDTKISLFAEEKEVYETLIKPHEREWFRYSEKFNPNGQEDFRRDWAEYVTKAKAEVAAQTQKSKEPALPTKEDQADLEAFFEAIFGEKNKSGKSLPSNVEQV
jgi:hypothetical protein